MPTLKEYYYEYSSPVTMIYKGDEVTVNGNFTTMFKDGSRDPRTQFGAVPLDNPYQNQDLDILIQYKHQEEHLLWAKNQ